MGRGVLISDQFWHVVFPVYVMFITSKKIRKKCLGMFSFLIHIFESYC